MKGPLIISDFDGTINRKDVSFNILNRFSGGRWDGIDKEFISGRIGSKEAYRRISPLLKGNEREWKRYAAGMEDVDPAFVDFLKKAGRKFPLVVVSDGFDLYIKEIFKKRGIDGVEFYSNTVRFEKGRVKIESPFSSHCGECGTCKRDILIRKRAEGYNPVIYIGDGYSDRCACLYADWIFAKRSLARILLSKKRSFSYLKNFGSVERWIEVRKSGIIFDLDGTLIDSYPSIISSMKSALIRMGVEPPPDETLKRVVGTPLNEIMAKFVGERFWEGVALFRKFYEANYRNGTKMIRGVRKVLDELRKKYYLLLVSNKHERFVGEIVRWKGIKKFFHFYIGESENLPPKPDPAMLVKAIDSAGLKPEDVLYVGDTSVDFLTASKLGIEFVAVTTGSEDALTLYENRPDSIVASLFDFLKMMRVREKFWK